MGAEIEIPIVAKIIAVIFCVLVVFLLAAYEMVLAWLGAGVKRVVKFVSAGVNHTAKTTHRKEEQLTGKTPRPDVV